MSKVSPLFLAVLVSVGVAAESRGERIITPGVYRGTYTVDRWGQKHFDSMLVSDQAAKALEPYRGKPVSALVTKVSQEDTLDPGTIHAIEKVEVLPVAPNLVLSVTGKSQRFKLGQAVTLTVSMENKSSDPVYLWPGWDIADLYVATSYTGRPREAKLGGDGRGRGRWLSESFWVDNGKISGRGLLDIGLRWRAQEYVKRGQKIRLAMESPNHPECVVVDPQGRFSADVIVDNDLPSGEYQAYWRIYHSVGKLASHHGPESARFDFDVTDKNEERRE